MGTHLNVLDTPAQKGIHVTERALKRIRIVMAKEGISPSEGGVRLGVQGGGCSGCFSLRMCAFS